MRALRLAAIALILAACQPAAPLTQSPVSAVRLQDARALWGHAAPAYRVQAVESDLKPYGTVSLLDTGNNVVATGTTDGSGNFSLNPFVSWTPTTSAVYVLELSKRFEGMDEGSLLRMRTLVSWTGTQWTSISGTTASVSGGSGVLINSGTTAIAAIQSLRGLALGNMLSSLDPNSGTFTPGSTGISATDFTTVKGMVGSDLAADLDPVRAITWSVPDGTYLNRLETKNGNLLFDLKDVPPQPGINPTPIRTKYGTGYAVAGSSAGLYLGQFGSWGTAGGDFEDPMDIAVDRYGNLYISNLLNSRVDKFDPNSNFQTSFGSNGTGNGQFNQVTGVTLDPLGNLWVSDYQNQRIQKLDPNGTFLMGIGEGSVWTSGSPPAVATGSANGWFSAPHYIRTDRYGNIWVSETGNSRIQEFAPNGSFVRGIGNGTTWTGAAPTPVASNANGYFSNGPTGFTFDSQGYLWVCDRGNNRIQKFDSNGNFLATYGSSGSGNGQFNVAESISVDGAGNFWVSDYQGQRIQKFDQSFNYLGQIGTVGVSGAAAGTFYNPRGLNFDSNGNLLVVDWGNHRVQRFAPASNPLIYPNLSNVTKGTVEVWFNPSWNVPMVSNAILVAMKGLNFNFSLGVSSPNLYMYIDDGTNVGRVGLSQTDSANLIQKGTWTHVAVTWNGPSGQLHFYLNGTEYASYYTPWPSSFNFGSVATCSIGDAISVPGRYAQAIIGSARIYDYPKSLTEIRRDAAMVEQY